MPRSFGTTSRNTKFSSLSAGALLVLLLVAPSPARAGGSHLLLLTTDDIKIELAQLPPRAAVDRLDVLRWQLRSAKPGSKQHTGLAQAVVLIEILRANRLVPHRDPALSPPSPSLSLLADLTGSTAASDCRLGK